MRCEVNKIFFYVLHYLVEGLLSLGRRGQLVDAGCPLPCGSWIKVRYSGLSSGFKLRFLK